MGTLMPAAGISTIAELDGVGASVAVAKEPDARLVHARPIQARGQGLHLPSEANSHEQCCNIVVYKKWPDLWGCLLLECSMSIGQIILLFTHCLINFYLFF
jgi:hypothetical protein